MFRILVKKYAGESWLLLVCSATILLMFTWVRIWTVAQFELTGFAPVLEQMKMFEKFSPVPLEQFLTHVGVIGLSFAEPILLLCILTWSISRGSDVISGEMNRGTMEMLLAQPVPRHRIVLAHALVSVVGLAILCGASLLGIVGGIYTNSTLIAEYPEAITIMNVEVTPFWLEPTKRMIPLSEIVDVQYYLAPTLNLFALGFFVLALSVLVGAFDQYRWRTIGIVVGIYILQALLFILGKSTPQTSFLIPFSFLAAYQPDWMVQAVSTLDISPLAIVIESDNGIGYQFGPLGFSLVLIALGLLAYGVAIVNFVRRDIPAPI